MTRTTTTSRRSYMPQQTVELAHQLAHDWGLDATAPGFPGTTGFTDLLRPPGAPVSVQDELLAGMGYELPAADRPAYPGVSSSPGLGAGEQAGAKTAQRRQPARRAAR